jgi:hypothetical protein
MMFYITIFSFSKLQSFVDLHALYLTSKSYLCCLSPGTTEHAGNAFDVQDEETSKGLFLLQ